MVYGVHVCVDRKQLFVVMSCDEMETNERRKEGCEWCLRIPREFQGIENDYVPAALTPLGIIRVYDESWLRLHSATPSALVELDRA
jgi:hypothetical protein